MNNYINVTIKFLESLNIKYTKKFITDSLLSHPDFPSLLSISNTLDKYNAENISMKVDLDKFDEIPTPCIVQIIKNQEPQLYVLKEITKQHVSFYDENNKLKAENKHDFLNIWTGNCLFAEKTEKTKEPEIEKKLTENKINTTLIIFTIIFLFISSTYSLLTLKENTSAYKFSIALAFIVLKVIGTITSSLLLWYEIDKTNPLLQNFCSRGKKTNCDQVLNSKYSTLFKGSLNLSSIAFSYFLGSLLFLLITMNTPNAFTVISFLSLTTIQAIILSIYYQSVKIKKWCKFCLIIQATLVGEILLSLNFKLDFKLITLDKLSILVFTTTIPLLIWLFVKPLLALKKSNNYYKRNFIKLKTDKSVFETFLNKSKRIATSTENLGIEIKNQKSKIKIIKVCNPYCSPCEKAHHILDELVTKEIIDLQIIFTTKPDRKDIGYYPVNHLLTISKNNDHLFTKKALDDWYKIGNKDYNLFKLENPIEITEHESDLRAMNEWCNSENIMYTPTIYVNGHKLPEEYSIEELESILT